jgi:uncharacterized protein YjbI with pentapeptide repeats
MLLNIGDMRKIFYIVVLILVGINLVLVLPTSAAIRLSPDPELEKAWNEGTWTGKREDGSIITKQDIEKILADHQKWLETNGTDGAQINLKKADLSKALLTSANLQKARFDECVFNEAYLWSANFSSAHVIDTNFNKAYLAATKFWNTFLYDVNFTNAYLWYSKFSAGSTIRANFTNANIAYANLNKTYLTETNFTGANLSNTDLSEATLSGTILSGADLRGTDLREATFNPETLPLTNTIASAKNLSTLRYSEIPNKLIELRKAFKDAGLRRQEGEITYAIKHTQRLELLNKNSSIWNKLEGLFNLILFEWPCEYGMKPGRPLLILIFWIIPLFSIFYFFALAWPPKMDGIWKVWVSERVRKDLGSKDPDRLKLKFLPAIAFGFYFSVISAFSIGWRDFNVGNWITRIQRREYTLRASGWVRTVSGAQSLVSVYLLALWVLTYFGRPFENV